MFITKIRGSVQFSIPIFACLVLTARAAMQRQHCVNFSLSFGLNQTKVQCLFQCFQQESSNSSKNREAKTYGSLPSSATEDITRHNLEQGTQPCLSAVSDAQPLPRGLELLGYPQRKQKLHVTWLAHTL